MKNRNYTVRIELDVTANTPEQAARYALDDIADQDCRPLYVNVDSARGTTVVEVDSDGRTRHVPNDRSAA